MTSLLLWSIYPPNRSINDELLRLLQLHLDHPVQEQPHHDLGGGQEPRRSPPDDREVHRRLPENAQEHRDLRAQQPVRAPVRRRPRDGPATEAPDPLEPRLEQLHRRDPRQEHRRTARVGRANLRARERAVLLVGPRAQDFLPVVSSLVLRFNTSN